MPRDGSDVYYLPPGTEGVPDTTIESNKYNLFIEDVELDLNTPRPIVAGGTGASTPEDAMSELGGELALQHVLNYDSHIWQSGSFWSAAGATNAPVAGHAFVGIVYSSDLAAIPPANLNLVVEARDQNDTLVPGRVYVREKKAGTWGPWKLGGGTVIVGGAEGIASEAGDMFFGIRGTAPASSFVVNDKKDASGVDRLIVEKDGSVIVPQDPVNPFDIATKNYVDNQNVVTTGATKTYVDNANAAQDTTIALKADKTYVDAQNATQNTNITNNTTAIGTNTTNIAAVVASDALKAPIDNPVFTGDARAVTPAPTDNDTSIATTAFVKTALSNAGVGTLGLARSVLAIQNQNLTTGFQAYYAGQTTICVMKDGTVRSAGYPGTVNNQSLGKGSGGNAATTVDLKKVGLPAGLLGTPVSVFHTGGECFILTDQGDVCGAGRNTHGQLGVGDLVAREIFTLLSAGNIGPRSAGGASRKVVDIIVSISGYNPNTPNSAPVWFRCADNTLWACGINTSNQLGTGDAVNKNVPTQCVKNDGAGNVVVADCAKVYAYGNDLNSVGYIDTLGKLRLAGRLQGGAAGRNSTSGASNVFRPVFSVTDNAGSELPAAYQCIDILFSLSDLTLIRCADKCLYAWGTQSQGQIGIGNTTQFTMPKKVGAGTGVAAAFNGNVERVFSSCACNNFGNFICQMTDGTVYCWGGKQSANLPITAADGSITTPVTAQGLLSGAGVPVINKVFGNTIAGTGTANQTLFCWLADGRILAWGPNGMDGVGTFNSANPRQVTVPARPGSPTIVTVCAGCDHSGGGNGNSFWIVLSDGYMLTMGVSVPDGIGGSSLSLNEASVPVQ